MFVFLVKTMSMLRTGDDGAWRIMSLLGASLWDTSMPPLLHPVSGPARCRHPRLRHRLWVCLGLSALLRQLRSQQSVRSIRGVEVCSLVKTMSGARIGDNGAWCVMSLLRVSFWDISTLTLLAAWFSCGMPWVVVSLGVAYLSSLDTSSPWSASATTTLADTLPSLFWRMLCCPVSLGLANTLPPLLLLL